MNKHEQNKQIEMQHAFQHNIYVKKMCFSNDGCVYRGHHHEYDHVTLVASGKVLVKFGAVPEANLPEEQREYEGVSMFVTRSFRTHEITALEPNTVVCCIHAIRTKDGEIIDPPSELSDQTLHSFDQLATAIKGMDLRPIAFDATPNQMDMFIERAKEEGTLEQGSGDKLV